MFSSSFSTPERYSRIFFTRSSLPFDSSFCSIEEMIRHDERRPPITCLNATERRLRSSMESSWPRPATCTPNTNHATFTPMETSVVVSNAPSSVCDTHSEPSGHSLHGNIITTNPTKKKGMEEEKKKNRKGPSIRTRIHTFFMASTISVQGNIPPRKRNPQPD